VTIAESAFLPAWTYSRGKSGEPTSLSGRLAPIHGWEDGGGDGDSCDRAVRKQCGFDGRLRGRLHGRMETAAKTKTTSEPATRTTSKLRERLRRARSADVRRMRDLAS
jgi:hypothetical protein